MSNPNQDFLNQVSHFLTIIPQEYLSALLTLHERLDGKNIKWIVNGDLAERLRVVKVNPDCIEIITSKEGAQKIFLAVQEFNPQKLNFQKQRLLRAAECGKEKYLVYARSHYFDFKVNAVTVKVEGDLQFKVDDWDWGEVFDFTPEYVYVTGKKIAVTPLSILSDFYRSLGWIDRVEKIEQITKKPPMAKKSF
jgi:hypothetical protein